MPHANDAVTRRIGDDAEATLVLIPGLMCDARFWQATVEAFESSRRVVIPSLHDLDSLGAMAESILDETEGRIDVVGHSMGGRVALELFALAPDRVRSMALLDTGVHPVSADEPARRRELLDLADTRGLGAVAERWIPMMIHPDRIADHRLVADITEMVTSYRTDQFRCQVRALLGRRDATPILASIDRPTLIACGSHDGWSPPDQHREIAAAVAGSRFELIADAGHMVAMERPEATTRLLADWLGARLDTR